MKLLKNSPTKLLAALCIFAFFAGCAQSQPVLPSQEMYYSFTDSTGYCVSLAAKPQKTAVLFSSFAEIWNLSGGEIAVTVGESIERGFADKNVVLVDDGAGKALDKERLLAENCDFVIGSADIPAQVAAITLLRQQGVACALFSVEELADYLTVRRICCNINEHPSAYEAHGVAVQNSIDALLANLPEAHTEKTVLFIRSGASASSAKAKTADDHFAAAMLKELGTKNIAENAKILTENLSAEEILLQDPDFIFIATMGNEKAAKDYMTSVLQSEAYSTLTAVRENRFFFLPKDLFQFKPNSRWAEAYAYLAQIVYE